MVRSHNSFLENRFPAGLCTHLEFCSKRIFLCDMNERTCLMIYERRDFVNTRLLVHKVSVHEWILETTNPHVSAIIISSSLLHNYSEMFFPSKWARVHFNVDDWTSKVTPKLEKLLKFLNKTPELRIQGGTPPPLWLKISLFSCSFRKKMAK